MTTDTSGRERVREQALRLFAERGVDAVSMRDIAGAAGMKAASLYNHWPSREALVRELFLDGYAGYGRRLAELADGPGMFVERLERMVRLVCRLHGEDHTLFRFLLLNQHHHLAAFDEAAANPVEVFQRTVEGAMREGEIPYADPALMTAAIVGILVQAATFHLYGGAVGRLPQRLDAMADDIATLCNRLLSIHGEIH